MPKHADAAVDFDPMAQLAARDHVVDMALGDTPRWR
jgi:hypothetical protein